MHKVDREPAGRKGELNSHVQSEHRADVLLHDKFIITKFKSKAMIERIDIGDQRVLAFRIEGKLDMNDMDASRKVIEPALQSRDDFSLYLEMAADKGVEPEAILQRLKFVFSNFGLIKKKVKKMALVTDKGWLQKLASIVFNLIPAMEQRSFSFEETREARNWVKQ
jgi:hypothetical protein